MEEVLLPSFEVVVFLHDEVLKVTPGRPGVHDENLIRSAVSRPPTYMSYNDSDLHTVCALLLDSIARYHGFNDGNKRTSLITVIFTYTVNGTYLEFDMFLNDDFEELVLWVVKEKPDIAEISSKLKALTEKYELKGFDSVIEGLRRRFFSF